MSKQVANIVNPVFDHRRSFQRQSPSNNTYILRQAHGSEHFWSEHTRITNLGPFLQVWMIAEYLHTWFSVRVKCWLETKLGDPNLTKEGFDSTNKITQT